MVAIIAAEEHTLRQRFETKTKAFTWRTTCNQVTDGRVGFFACCVAHDHRPSARTDTLLRPDTPMDTHLLEIHAISETSFTGTHARLRLIVRCIEPWMPFMACAVRGVCMLGAASA